MPPTKVVLFFFNLYLVNSFSFYRDRIPNGNNVPDPCNPSDVWSGVGHRNPAGGGVRNPFGEDFALAGHQWTKELCEKDSDGDRRSNGLELGDPACQWSPTSPPLSSSNMSHPGICEPVGSELCRSLPFKFTCSAPPSGFNCPAVEEPHVQQFRLQFPRMKVPSDVTNYFCQIFEVPNDKKYHAIGFEPVIDNINVLHHMLIFGCKSENLQQGDPVRCGMTMPQCRDLIGLWSTGMSGYCLRDNVGVPFGVDSYKYIAIQLHWNNPEQASHYYDQSGIIMHYTDQIRHFSEQTGSVGQLRLNIPPLSPQVTANGHCKSWCTKRMGKPANITSAYLHMHYLGYGGKMDLYRNGVHIRNILTDGYYDYDTPVQHIFDPPLTFLPGDEFTMECNFNSLDGSRRRETHTRFGSATEDEMCFVFFTYYSADPNSPDIKNYFWVNDGTNLICREGMPAHLAWSLL